MCRTRIFAFTNVIFSLFTTAASVRGTGSVQPNRALVPEVGISEAFGKLPLYFEANRGQTDQQVRFLSRGARQTLFLTSTEAVLVLAKPKPVVNGRLDKGKHATRRAVLRMAFIGANPRPHVAGRDELPGKANYFIGSDPKKWHTSVPTYARAQYQDLYPGIDLTFYGNQRHLEYDFVVRVGADPKSIRLGFEGADKLEVDGEGNLMLHTAAGAIRQQRPFIYQQVDGVRRAISGGYVLKSKDRVGFQVATYDTSRPLVIDPVLFYSTYLGGSGNDQGFGIAVDSSGNAYVTGSTGSTNFPRTAGAFQTTYGGGSEDAFITKLNPTGSGLVYSTYLGAGGGFGNDEAHGIAVDSVGNAYVTGSTNSTNFPTTPGAFQPTVPFKNCSAVGCTTAFVTKINPTGSALVYSTYLGGSGEDSGTAIAVDAAGNAYIGGGAQSSNFPTTPGVFQPTPGGVSGSSSGVGDVFVTKLNPIGSALVYSTYIGGSLSEGAVGIAIDAAGNAYVTGATQSSNFPTTAGAFQTTHGGGLDSAFVTKLNPTGTRLVYSTFLGGNSDDAAHGIAIDSLGDAYVTGYTSSTNFPTTAVAFQTTYGGSTDAFVAKLNPAGTGLVYSTYLGGSGQDVGSGISLDGSGNVYVTGYTNSTNFPTVNPIQATFGGGAYDAIVTKLNPLGSGLVYSTYLGGSGIDQSFGIAIDSLPNPNAYVAGLTNSTNFPTTAGALQTSFGGGSSDAFVAKITEFQPDAPITAQGTAFGATEGVTFTGTVATFTDPDPASTAAEYSATIDWGDTTPTTPGTITGGPGNAPYTVSGTHMYTEQGTYAATVTITDVDNPKNNATVTSTARVTDARLSSTCATMPVSTQTYTGPTAIFTDQSSTGTLSDFSATISWGDSSSSPGTITGGPGNAPYTVSGTHTYASTGIFLITTTITDVGGSTTTTPACSVTIFAFPTVTGAFVIGDLADPLPIVGDSVTWWSSQWAQLNPMSGGPAPASMKGFAGFEDNPTGTPRICGSSWTTDTGNATPPPPSVPPFMGVLVSSTITQNGSVITGNIKQVVVVHNNPGYAPDPGHPGTGTIVAIVCVSP